jgi:cytochrome c2
MRDVFIWLAIGGLLVAVLVGGAAVDARLRGHADEQPARQASSGDPELGRLKFREYGCGACHTVAGVPGAMGKVGPGLNDLRTRYYLAGRLENTQANLEEWIRHPQKVEPGTLMPDTGVSAEDAAHITAYLYSLR